MPLYPASSPLLFQSASDPRKGSPEAWCPAQVERLLASEEPTPIALGADQVRRLMCTPISLRQAACHEYVCSLNEHLLAAMTVIKAVRRKPQEPGDPELVAAQQSRLLALACRTMARPLGRGALTLGEPAPAGAASSPSRQHWSCSPGANHVCLHRQAEWTLLFSCSGGWTSSLQTA